VAAAGHLDLVEDGEPGIDCLAAEQGQVSHGLTPQTSYQWSQGTLRQVGKSSFLRSNADTLTVRRYNL
jgi:hypothetical protein